MLGPGNFRAVTKQWCSFLLDSEIISPTAVLSLLCPLLTESSLKSDTQSGCVWVFECCYACMYVFVWGCTFIVNREATRSLSEFFVLQQEHMMTGPFVWSDTIIHLLSLPTSPPSSSLSFFLAPSFFLSYSPLLEWKHLKDNYPCGLGRCRDEDIFFSFLGT